MKKLDWAIVIMVIIILAMTIIGVRLMEDEWIEAASSAIWIAGMVLITETFLIRRLEKFMVKLVKEEYDLEDAD